MYRIYRFRIWTMHNECYLYDAIFENAREALTFIYDNYLDPDNAALRIDAIDFIDNSTVDLSNWMHPTDSSWYNPEMLFINDPLGIQPIEYDI